MGQFFKGFKNRISLFLIFALIFSGVIFLAACSDDDTPKAGAADKTALQTAITAANNKKAGVEISVNGTELPPAKTWVTSIVMKTFEDAIEAAEKVEENAKATQSQVNKAVEDLNAAIAAFQPAPGTFLVNYGDLESAISAANLKKTGVVTSANGIDIDDDKNWVTAAVLKTFEDAIEAAEEVLDDDDAEQTEIDEALGILNDAITAFEPKPGTKDSRAALNALILDAEELRDGIEVSENGEDVSPNGKWVTEDIWDALDDAINAAEAALDDVTSTKAKFAAVKSDIEDAMENFVPEDGKAPAPRILSAEIETAVPNVIKVTFSIPVAVDQSKFIVKVNRTPGRTTRSMSTNAPNGIPMDNAAVVRSITNAVPVGGAINSETWNLTMSSPARFGDILRLATATANEGVFASTINPHIAGAAISDLDVELPAVPEFIVRHLIPRTIGAFENTPGLYRNGIRIDSITDHAGNAETGDGGQMYANTIAYFRANATQRPQPGDIVTLVLPGNQTYTGGATFEAGQAPDNDDYFNNPATFIITTPIGNTNEAVIRVGTTGQGLIIRNSLTVVFDEYVVIERGPDVVHNAQLVTVNDGGVFILNGGKIRNNTNTFTGGDNKAGGIRVGGGSAGCYFIFNSGEISGNTVNDSLNNDHGGAAGIFFMQYGIVVMHDGSVKNNTYNLVSPTATITRARAGGVADTAGNANTQHFNQSVFFMTGGEIAGNSVTGATNGVSAGGVVTHGGFQKTGGIIHGSDAEASLSNKNTTTGDNNVKVSGIAIIMQNVINPNITDDIPQARLRNTTAGANVPLFVQALKTNHNTSNNISTVPLWARSDWEN